MLFSIKTKCVFLLLLQNNKITLFTIYKIEVIINISIT